MIPIGIQKVSKRFGSTVALDALDLAIQPGELFFLLGASGCGKTTLLRCLAGFEKPDSGTIRFGESDVTGLAPHARNAGMVFQSYALWPHMTVAQNVAFGLEERRVEKGEIARRVAQALEAVQMGVLGERKPHQLTTVYVTHDQKEALAIADRMAVMEAGRILQIGTPREVYARPASAAVARFIGETNLIPGRFVGLDGGRLLVDTALGRFLGVAGDTGASFGRGAEVCVSVRPECWRLAREAPQRNGVRGRLAETFYLGELAQHRFVSGESELKLYELNPRFVGAAAQGEFWATVDPDDVVVLKG